MWLTMEWKLCQTSCKAGGFQRRDEDSLKKTECRATELEKTRMTSSVVKTVGKLHAKV